ncbi:PREDICTED: uncharacterized protein LOC108966029 [Bactrocera latifrons]|uniref:Zinc finger protein 324A n=2 Tax=Bactrocera latifrons TaxID=174628 RepID=A0A0K8ULL6_BACLA|nr:PREDICTED: uncharacterized protein LOC108966029 [Bactrocera latifrons]
MTFTGDFTRACAAATTPIAMTAIKANQQRIKCGEVFIWDCVGELFAIECLLCEEHPLCTLSEFAEHMDIWHYDWTAEAHASLPDTTTTADGCELLPKQWTEIESSAAAEERHTDMLSDGNSFEDNYSDSETISMASDSLETRSWHATSLLESDYSVAIMQNVTAVSSTETFEELLYGAEVGVWDNVNDLRSGEAYVERAQSNEAEELAADSAQANTMGTIVKKRVENPLLNRFRTEKLIEIYEKFPELWHKDERSSQKPETQAKAYHSISQKLKKVGIHLKTAAVQRRLNALRKRYRLEKLEELKAHLKGQIYESSFEYYAHLQFLREHIEPELCKICMRICKDAKECCEGAEETRTEKLPINNEASESGVVVAEGREGSEARCVVKEALQADEESIKESNAESNEGSNEKSNEKSIEENIESSNEGSTERTNEASSEEIREENSEERNEVQHSVNEITLQLSKSAAEQFEVMVEEILKSEHAMQEANLETSELEIESNEFEPVDTTLNEVVMAIEQTNGNPEGPMLQENFEVNENPNASVKDSMELVAVVDTTKKLHEAITFLEQSEGSLEGSILQDILKVDRNQNESVKESRLPRRSLRNRSKVQILEVLELPRMQPFKAQELAISTSTPHGQQAVGINECMSTADENMASEEYDSSNGDSGILRDYDEQPDAETNHANETGSFARLTAEQTHKLIELYGQHPLLWDPDHADFRARAQRRNVWRQITAQLNGHFQKRYTWTKVHRKMHDYIKYYRRERQRIELEGGCTRWCFYDDFAFLNEVLAEQSSEASKLLLNKQHNMKIIEVYAAHPQLWDTNHALYKRRRLRQSIFKAISDQLRDAHNINISALKLKQRIVEFRCTYRMEKERRCATEQRGETYEPCYEYYQLLSFLDAHIAPFQCAECSAQFKKHTEIERHMRQAHSKNKKKTIVKQRAELLAHDAKLVTLENVCHICGIGFTLSRNLMCHLKRHTNQREYQCVHCPKKFFDGATLRVHERSHTKSRPYVCEQCGASYATGSKLNQHLKRHSGQRDFTCELCDKAFFTAFECERHMRTHMNIREKVCPICGRDFGVGSGYYAHMLLHTGVKRYKCTMCGKQFAQFAGLYKHRKRYHPKEFALERAKKNGRVAKEVAAK